jgi:hypothetical protein
MTLRIQKYLLSTISKLAAVVVHLSGRDAVVYHALIVEKRKGEIRIVDRKQQIETEEELQAFLPKGCPLVVNIEGWGILVKKTSFDENGNITTHLVSDPEEFELFPFFDGQKEGFVSIIRKELFQQIRAKLNDLKCDLLEISAGPLDVSMLLPVLKLEGEQIVGAYDLLVENKAIKDVKPVRTESNNIYKLGDDVISSTYLPAFSLSAKVFSAYLQPSVLSDGELVENFLYKKLTFFVGWAVLGLLFTGLFVNYLLFSKYDEQFDQVSGEFRLNESLIKKLDGANKELEQAKDLMVKGGLTGETSFAWFADKLSLLMPAKVIMTRLSFQEPEKSLKNGYKVELKENIILIEGETLDAVKIYQWIQKIKNEKWVKEVEMISYSKENEREPATFGLQIIF